MDPYDIFLSDLRAFQTTLTPKDEADGAFARISTFDNKTYFVEKNAEEKNNTVGLYWVEYPISHETDINQFAMEAYTKLALIIAFSQTNVRERAHLN